MAEHEPAAATFKELERQGWGAKADNYNALAGQITAGAVAPLLDATGVHAGTQILDVATGPGYVAAGADARGAHAIGIDFAADMVAAARRRYPRIEFREGDAENLAFDPESFDAVVCAFGILHIADPDKAIAEAYRVLRPDGRFAFTVWAGPDRHDFFAIVLKALEAHGNTQVSLPPAPPIFRFSDPGECRKASDASRLRRCFRGRIGAEMERAIDRGDPRLHLQKHRAHIDGARAPDARCARSHSRSNSQECRALCTGRGLRDRLAGRACGGAQATLLERDELWFDRHPALAFLFEHDLFGKPDSTFPDHAPNAQRYFGGAGEDRI